MENFPAALVIASYDAVCHNNNVMYRLVRPLPDGVGVQSTDKMVNVVPFRRNYMFEKKHQLDEFAQQMLRRPLVLQPVLHFGRGIGHYCAATYQDELWLVMVNQTHPKILSRLQMGLDAAKAALERGQPFEIRFRFGRLIQRVYREHLKQKERGEAHSKLTECLTHFRFAEWEYGDLNLRYHGYGANLNRSSALHSLPNLELKWDFEDIGMHEMVWSQFDGQKFPRPHLSPVSEDEIRQLLPAWTINTVSPLENIGDSVPENNYNYAQAGRLYASFRKKRKPRDKAQHDAMPGPSTYSNDNSDEQYQEEDLEGAIGYDPSAYPEFAVYDEDYDNAAVIEHDFSDHAGHYPPHNSRHVYHEVNDYDNDLDIQYQNVDQKISSKHLPQQYDNDYNSSGTRIQPASNSNYNAQTPSNNSKTGKPDKYGHIHANVEIRSNAAPHHHHQTQVPGHATRYPDSRMYETINPAADLNHYAGNFNKQGSDRSSRSTNADSGYCPDGDGDHSRGGSYDNNEQTYRLQQKFQGYENLTNKNYNNDRDGLENPAFRYDNHDLDNGLQRHKELVSQAMREQLGGNKPKRIAGSMSSHYNNEGPLSPHTENSGNIMKAPPRQKKVAAASSCDVSKVAESFI